MEIPAGHAHFDRVEPQAALHPRVVERVPQGDLTELNVPAVLDELLRRAAEQAADPRADRGALVPVLTDWNRLVGTGTDHGALERGIGLTDHVQVAAAGDTVRAIRPHFGVFVRAVGVQRGFGAVVDLATVLDVQQARQLQLVEPDGAADASGPAGIRVADHALLVVPDGLARRGDEVRTLGSAAAGVGRVGRGADVEIVARHHRVEPGGTDAAAREADVVEHSHFLTLDHRGSGRVVVGVQVDERRTSQALHQATVAGPLQAHVPPDIGVLDRPGVEGDLEAPVTERRGVLRLPLVAG